MWLKLEADGGKALKVTWGGQDGFFEGSYSIGVETLNAACADVRDELAKLSDWAVGGRPDLRWERLSALARAGRDLYRSLFDPANLQSRHKAIKELIRLEYSAGQRVLNVYADSSLHVPWGLAFDASVPEVPPDPTQPEAKKAEMELFGGFWALKYDLSVGSALRVPGSLDRKRETFGLLSLVTATIFDNVGAHPEDEPCRELYELMSARVGTAKSLKECEELIEETDATDILFHFFGHHHDQILDLGSGRTVSLLDFVELLGRLVDRCRECNAVPYGLLFLNGCDLATGKEDYSFKAMALEVFGVIATEAKVRTSFATRFGHRFLKSMMKDEQTVSATMHALWHAEDLWPESLLYGCYANPKYRIRSGAVATTGAR
jgi:hypothetical protein